MQEIVLGYDGGGGVDLLVGGGGYTHSVHVCVCFPMTLHASFSVWVVGHIYMFLNTPKSNDTCLFDLLDSWVFVCLCTCSKVLAVCSCQSVCASVCVFVGAGMCATVNDVTVGPVLCCVLMPT